MAGYSGTPLIQKLGIREGSRIAILGAPPGFAETLGPLPIAVTVRSRAAGALDLVLGFTKKRAELASKFASWAGPIAPAGCLWIAWPKKSSKVPTDLDENVVREIGLSHGLVDVKVCAVDEVWSGL